jgi:hypothetical protein
MSKQLEQVEPASADPGDPVLQAERAEPEIIGDDRRALPLAQPRQRNHHELDARHLAGKDVARQDPLPAVAAKADSQRDGEDLERREGVELARDAAARQARSRR